MVKNLYAVLTGDLVDYSKLEENERSQYIRYLRKILSELGSKNLVFEIFRGDSFQAVLPSSREALKVALIIRSYLIFQRFDSKTKIKPDVRIAIGVGSIENYDKSNISSCDGEAFRNSGPELDRMDKKRQRIMIKTEWTYINKELRTECFLLDAIISKWTKTQAETVYYSLSGKNQSEIGKILDSSQGNVSSRLNSANYDAARVMVERYTELIDGGVVHIYLNEINTDDPGSGLKCLVTRHPDSPVFHREYGSYLCETGNPWRAIDEYRIVLNRVPDDYGTRTDLAYALKETGNTREAEYECKKLLRVREDNVPTLYLLGEIYEEAGNLSESEKYYRKASYYADPDDLKPLNCLIDILFNQDKYDEAEEEINKILAVNPGDYKSLYFLNSIEISRGNPDAGKNRVEIGIKYLEENLENSEDETDSLIDLALLNLLMDKSLEAEIYLSTVIEKDPDNSNAHNLLAGLYLKKGEYIKSENELKISINLDPDEYAGYYLLGHVLLKKGEFEAAKGYLKKSIDLNPDFANQYFLLGMAEYALGNIGMAGIQFARAHEINPDFQESEKVISDLTSGSLEEEGL